MAEPAEGTSAEAAPADNDRRDDRRESRRYDDDKYDRRRDDDQWRSRRDSSRDRDWRGRDDRRDRDSWYESRGSGRDDWKGRGDREWRDRDRDREWKRERSRSYDRSYKRSRNDSRGRDSGRSKWDSDARPSADAQPSGESSSALAVPEGAEKRRSGWDNDMARAAEQAADAAQKSRRSRRSGWDMTEADPSAAPTPSLDSARSGQAISHFGGHPQTGERLGGAGPAGAPPLGADMGGSAMGMQSGAPQPHLANYGLPVFTINIKQNCVARVVGRGGETVKQVEQQTGAIVKLDRENMKHAGISICRIYGPLGAAQKAADMIRLKIASVAPVAQSDLPEGFFTEEFRVEPRLIGLILGRGGEGLRKIQEESGASVCFHKDEDNLDMGGVPRGDSFHIVGRRENVDRAKALVAARLETENTVTFGKEGEIEENTPRPGEVVHELPIDQQFVGRIIGKGKAAIKQITDQTGARIQLDRTTKDRGYCIIRIMGNPDNAQTAYNQLAQQLERAQKGASDLAGDWNCVNCGEIQLARNRSCRKCGTEQPPEVTIANAAKDRVADDEIRVDQKYVGFLMGPGGVTLKGFKEISGCRVFIDQDTKGLGFSVVRIASPGTPENKHAHELVRQKLQECKDLPSNRLEIQKEHMAMGGPPVMMAGGKGQQKSTIMLNPVVKGPGPGAVVIPPPPPQQSDNSWGNPSKGEWNDQAQGKGNWGWNDNQGNQGKGGWNNNPQGKGGWNDNFQGNGGWNEQPKGKGGWNDPPQGGGPLGGGPLGGGWSEPSPQPWNAPPPPQPPANDWGSPPPPAFSPPPPAVQDWSAPPAPALQDWSAPSPSQGGWSAPSPHEWTPPPPVQDSFAPPPQDMMPQQDWSAMPPPQADNPNVPVAFRGAAPPQRKVGGGKIVMAVPVSRS